MAIVGSAEIVVRALTNKVRDDIQKGLRDALPAISSEGERAGKAYSDGFGKGSSSGNLGRSFEDSLRRANLSETAGRAGRDAGGSIIDEAGNEMKAEAGKLGSSAEAAFSGAGRRGGNGFLSGFISSDFGKAAGKASQALTQLIGVGNLVGPGIAGLVSALSGAVSGLFAMASAASQAVGVLAVLPGVISVAAQAFGTLKLAFSGVSKALTAGFTAATASTATTAQAAISSARSVADARTALARASQAAAQAMVTADQQVAAADTALNRARQAAATALADATRTVARAETDVATAQRVTLAAQQALNAARQQGIKDLRDLAFQAEDAGLAEQQSALDLEDARKRLQEAQNLPADDPARQAAELAFKQADLAYREAKARNQDLQAEEKKAAKAGVDGTSAVVSAKQKINDALKSQQSAEQQLADAQRARQQTELKSAQSIADAEKALAQARASRAQTQIKNAQSISDAQLRLNRALADQATALAQGTSQANAYQTALAKLSPPAQEFVKHLVAMKPAFDSLKAAAGAELFPSLTTAIDLLAKNVFPVLETHLRTTGGLLGQLGLDFAETVSQGEGLNRLHQILAGNNGLLKIFTDRTKTGRSTLGNFTLVAERLLVVIQPITRRFAEWIKSLSVLAAHATNTSTKLDGFRKFLKGAGDTAAQLGRIFGNLIRALLILGGASKKSGKGLLDSFEQATKHLDKFLAKLRDNGTLRKFFRNAAFNLRQVGKLFDAIAAQLIKLGGDKNGGKFADSLIPAVKVFGDISKFLTDASPKLGPLATQLGNVIKQLTSPGQTSAFIGTLTTIVKVINSIFHGAEDANGFIKDHFNVNLLKILGIAFAVHRALAFAFVPLKFFGEALIGGPRNVLAGLTKMRDVFKTFKSDGFKKAFTELTNGSDKSKKALEKQMTVDDLKKKSLQELGNAATIAADKLKLFKDAAAPLPGEMQAIGADTAKGLTLGFEENSQGFVDAMVNIAKEAVKAIQIELGIASPSKVFEKIGREAGQGYVIGLESESGAAAAAGSQLGTASATGAAESSTLGAAGSAGGVGTAAKAGATVEKDAVKAEKAGGKMASVFGKIGKLVGGAAGLFLPFDIALEGAGAAIGAAIVPILAIAAAIAAFVGMFILLYKQSPQFKKFIDNIVGKLKDLGHWFKDVVLPIIINFAEWLGKKFVALVVPPINAFFGVVNAVLPKIGDLFGVTFHAIAVFWKDVLHPVINAIIDIVKFLWKFVIHPYLKLIQLEFKIIFTLIKLYWEHILKPVIKAIIDVIKFLWKNVFKPYFELIWGIIKLVFNAIKTVWDHVLHPVFDAISSVISDLLGKFQDVFGKIKKIWDDFVAGIKDVKKTVGDIVDGIGKVFSGLGNIIKNAFTDAYKFMGRGVNAIIGAINKYLIGGLNAIGGKFGIEIGTIDKIPGLARGGRVRGRGGERQDNLPHLLSNNEFVIQAASARKIGYDKLEKANKTGDLSFGGLSLPHPHIPGFSTIKNLVGDTINGVENVGEKIAKEGLGKVLEALVKGAENLMVGAGIKRGSYFNDLVYGVMDKLASAVKDWGGDAGQGVSRDPGFGKALKGFLNFSGRWAFPVAGRYTYNSGYPYGSSDGQGGFHTGSDFDARVGTPLVAMGPGTVMGVTNLGDRSYGRYVTINYGAFQTLYAHMNAFAAGLRAGMSTKAGTPIGQVGWYGNVSPKSPAGAHLHLEASTRAAFGSMSNTFNPLELLRRLGFKFARGGVVSPTDGGILGVIGEAGHHERIEPLDSEGFSKRDRAILDMIQQVLTRDGGGDTIVVNPSRGMDERELATLVARRMQFRRRTGV